MIYLDNAATTKLSKAAKKAMKPFFNKVYGNASSINIAGQIAKESLEDARKKVANVLNANSNEIYFTSGGSEGDNWAIEIACEIGKRTGKKHIITSQIEHHAILNKLKQKEKEGFSITYLPVGKNGIVDVCDLKNAITSETCLVTIMFANNEIGTIQPIEEIGKICRENNILFHTDAVQAVGHTKIDVKKMNIDMLSFSSHKFYGPKGVGGMFVRRGIPISNLIFGGAQESNKRAGTENVAGIVGMATALCECEKNMERENNREIILRNILLSELSKISHSKINGDINSRLSNNVNISFEGIEGESLLLMLSDNKICASSGSACTSGSLDPSHVLLAIGLPHEIAHGSLRLTLGRYNTKRQIKKTIKIVKEKVEILRKMSPVWDKMQKGELKYVLQ